MKSTSKVLYYLKKGVEERNGEVMIMARITVDGKVCQFSTKQSILPKDWSVKSCRAIGRSASIVQINSLLDEIKSSLHTIYHDIHSSKNILGSSLQNTEKSNSCVQYRITHYSSLSFSGSKIRIRSGFKAETLSTLIVLNRY